MLLLDVYQGLDGVAARHDPQAADRGRAAQDASDDELPLAGRDARRSRQVRAGDRAGRGGRLGLLPRAGRGDAVLPGAGRATAWPCRPCAARPTCSRARRYPASAATSIGNGPARPAAAGRAARAVAHQARPGRLLAAGFRRAGPAGARRQCVRCHRPGGEGDGAKTDLTAAKHTRRWSTTAAPEPGQHVLDRWYAKAVRRPGPVRAAPARCWRCWAGALRGALTAADRERLVTWMDTYGQLRFVQPGARAASAPTAQSLQPLFDAAQIDRKPRRAKPVSRRTLTLSLAPAKLLESRHALPLLPLARRSFP